VAVSNGTVALDLALKVLGLGPGDEVISPAFTFIATANSILYQGSKPIFADVHEKTFNIDPDDLLEKINSKTRAVIGVHLYGQPFDLKAVSQICEDHILPWSRTAPRLTGLSSRAKEWAALESDASPFIPPRT